MNYKIECIKKVCRLNNIEFKDFMNELEIPYDKYICGENCDEIYLSPEDKVTISRKLNIIVPYFYGIIEDKHLFENNLTLDKYNESKRAFKIENYLKSIGMDDYIHNIFEPTCEDFLSDSYLSELIRYTYKNISDLSKSEQYKYHYVKNYPMFIKDMTNPSEDVSMSAVSSCGDMIKYVKWQTEDIAYKAVSNTGDALEYVVPSFQTEKVVKAAIKQNPLAFKYCASPTYDICLYALKANGNNLEFVPKELINHEMIITALGSNGWAIKFVENQTEEYALTAVLQNTESCLYVDEEIRENNACIKHIYNEIIKRHDFLAI